MIQFGFGFGFDTALKIKSGDTVPAPYPAPTGYRWEFVTESNSTDPNVFENGERVVELASIAA